MSSSTSRSRRPSTATLQQFASSSSHRGGGGGASHSDGGGGIYHSSASLPHKHSNGDNTSATTAESTSWSSSRSANYGVFPRSHPNHSNNTQLHHSSASSGSSRTISYFQKQQNQQASSPPPPASPPRDRRYATPPRRSKSSARSEAVAHNNHGYVPQQQQQQQQQHYMVRQTYRDDYSRSQHSADGDNDSWNNNHRTDLSIDTPPQQQQQRHPQPPMSDPGTHNRFAAYVNRFATVDPRMDYTESLSPPASPHYQRHSSAPRNSSNSNSYSQYHVRSSPVQQHDMLEEKKEDANATTKTSDRHHHPNHNPAEHVKDPEEYPDPDFGMEQMLEAERAYMRSRPPASRGRGRPSDETASAATTSVLHSPNSSNRTRHLARRFEERMVSQKGSFDQQQPPWNRDNAQYERSLSRGHSQPPSSTQSEVATTTKTASPPRDYRSRSEIETPSPARVSALKQKLWDASESLNVKVRPSSTGRPANPLRNARSLSPKTSRRVYQHFNNSQQQQQAQHQSHADPIRNPTHFEWTEARRGVEEDHQSRSSTGRDDAAAAAAREDRSYRSRGGGGDDRSYKSSGGGRDDRSYKSASGGGRDDRSYKSREDVIRPGYTARDDRSRSSSSHQGGETRRSSPPQQLQQVRSTSNPRNVQVPPQDPYEGSGGELQNSPFFKSRFFEAAEKTVDTQQLRRSLSRANSSSSSVERGIAPTHSEISRQESLTATRFFQRQLDDTEDEFLPVAPKEAVYHAATNNENNHRMMPTAPTTGTTSSVGSGGRAMSAAPLASSVANSAVGVNSYASTPIVTNRPENVAHLLAKLQSVNRADPTAALREIDAILKAESSNSRSTATAPPPPPPAAQPASFEEEQQHHPHDGGDEDDDAGDSETETTVSSITNPTFSGHGRHRKKKHQQPHSPSQPLPTTVEGEAAAHGVKPLKDPSRDPWESRRKKVRSPPPDTIQVGNRGAGTRHNVDRNVNLDQNATEERVVGDTLDKILQAPYDSTAELAEKIRRWDELSGKGSAPEVKTPELLSDTTDALGNTEIPSADGLPGKRKTHHPWDASVPTRRGMIDMRDTSMDNGAGVETHYSPHSPSKQMKRNRQPIIQERRHPTIDERNNPFAQDSDHESRSQMSRSREGSRNHIPRETVVNMSADFDDAWVTLPTSNFFKAETPQRGTASDQQSTESPMPPPVSAKKASVEKFSPKRLEAVNREMDYNPPSHRAGRAEGVSAYDEKRIDQARTEDEADDDGIEVSLVDEKKEPKRKGLRALLNRRNSKSNLLGSASVVSSGSRRRNQTTGSYKTDGEPAPARSASRGRRRSVTPSRERSHSLEEGNIRNPNIARKFSRFMKVYNDEDRRPAEV